MAAIDLALVRQQCNIVGEVEDALLLQYIAAATAHVEQHCDRQIVESPISEDQMAMSADVVQAILLLVGHWVSNREAVVIGEVSNTVQLGVERLLWYRKRF
ncbi:MAG: phage gp6-like head-tail connector protein [Pseudoxanthomonas spadix]|nr:MAG: phage gp6-like head-tail connector protein [Pseudoxanthomonas spadix]